MSSSLVTSGVKQNVAAFRFFAVMSGRDALRNPLTGLSMLFVFAWILIIYAGIWFAFTVLGPTPQVALVSANAELSSALEQAGVSVVDSASESGTPKAAANATITVTDKQATVVLVSTNQPAWNPIWHGLRAAGFSGNSITITDDTGDVKVDPLRSNLGVTAMGGIAAVALIGTTVPIIAMRERGLLRLFGTTPLRRSTFLLSHVPVRFAVVAVEMVVILAIAVAQRYTDGIEMLRLGVTLLLGSAMLFGIALLFAARLRKADAAQQGMAMLAILLVFVSGGGLPPELLSGIVVSVINCVPTTWFVAALNADLAGLTPFVPVPVLWVGMALVACVATVLAARLFEWDQAEPKQPKKLHEASERTHDGE